MTIPPPAAAPPAAPLHPGAARVLLPRPAGRGRNLVALLQEAGLVVEQHPFVELRLHEDAPLRDAARDLAAGEFDHLVLTSPRAVDALLAGDGTLRIPPEVTVTVVGEGTASALRSVGREPGRIASGSGAALVAQFPAAPSVAAPAGTDPLETADSAPSGTRVLFPASAAAAPTVPEGLAAKGYQVTKAVAYSPHPVDLDPQVTGSLRAGGYAVVVLTSSMIARITAQIGLHPGTRVVTIGDPTTAQASACGLTVHRQADAPTDQALAEAVLAVLADPGPAVPEPADPDSSAPDPEEDPS